MQELKVLSLQNPNDDVVVFVSDEMTKFKNQFLIQNIQNDISAISFSNVNHFCASVGKNLILSFEKVLNSDDANWQNNLKTLPNELIQNSLKDSLQNASLTMNEESKSHLKPELTLLFKDLMQSSIRFLNQKRRS